MEMNDEKEARVMQYLAALRKGEKHFSTAGLCGRIIRGRQPEDFTTLTDDPNRKLVMMLGPDGLRKLLGKSGYEMLVAVGYDLPYITRKVRDEGNQFKLVVLPLGGTPVLKATWKNVIEIAAQTYPEAAVDFRISLAQLRRLKTPSSPGWTMADWEWFERIVGFDFSEVDKIGASDYRFLTFERFRVLTAFRHLMTKTDWAFAVRAFLYFSLHLRELFAGNGYTYDARGKKGMSEYIVPNRPLADLGFYAILDLDVKIP